MIITLDRTFRCKYVNGDCTVKLSKNVVNNKIFQVFVDVYNTYHHRFTFKINTKEQFIKMNTISIASINDSLPESDRDYAVTVPKEKREYLIKWLSHFEKEILKYIL